MKDVSILLPIISRVRRDAYAVKRKSKGPACIREPFTDEHLEKHLLGQKSYGVYPIVANSSVTSIALLDLDSHRGETSWEDMLKTARLVSDELEKHGLSVIPWRSSGGHGIHLYMLWSEPQDAYSVREQLRTALENIGFKNGTDGVSAQEIEIFPKQSEVAEGRMGSMFILPLAGKSVPINSSDWSIKSRDAAASIEWPISKDVPVVSKPPPKPRPENIEHNEDLKRIGTMLEYISCEDYDVWIKIGLALHYETGGSYEALILWDEWSENGSNYLSYEDLEYRWDGFTHNLNNPATIGSIKKLAREGGWVENIAEDFEDLVFEEIPEKIIEAACELDIVQYDKQREEIAKKLGIRKPTLDLKVESYRKENAITERLEQSSMFTPVKPWPESVNGAELLNEIYETIGRFIVCDERTKIAATLWIAFTWLIDYVQVAPIALITAPEKRCGKSQLLSLIGKMAFRALMASNISSAAIYRVIEAHKPTLLIDEADTFMDDYKSEIGGVINSGHTRDTAYVIRVSGEELEAMQYSTWGAKAIAGIGKRSETIEDRSINLQLRRKLVTENVERLRYADDQMFKDISSKLARFAKDHGEDISALRPTLPNALNDRAQDNWEPLLCIADFVGFDWPEKARKAALDISKAEQDVPSIATELLADIKDIFENHHDDKIHSADLVTLLLADDEKLWSSYKRDKPITQRQLSDLLKGFGVRSKNIKLGGEVRKGYDLKNFEDVFARYLSDLSVNTLQTLSYERVEVADELAGSATNNATATSEYAETKESSEITDDFDDLC